MATIQVRRSHRLTLGEARGRLERAARSAQQRHSISWEWRGDALEVRPPPGVARGASGRVVVAEGSVHVQVELPLLLRPVRSVLEARVATRLEALLK
jgi:putative polyhydroxyalkanoate system protein